MDLFIKTGGTAGIQFSYDSNDEPAPPVVESTADPADKVLVVEPQ